MKNKTDVLVIGSGFGGSIAASRLTDAGLSVTLLERGPWRDTAAVRDMGIGERSSLPYGWSFYRRFLRNLQFGRFGSFMLSSKGLWEIYLNNGVSVACSAGVGGGSHVYTGLNEKPRTKGYWDGCHSGLSDATLECHYTRVMDEMGGKTLSGKEKTPNYPGDVWADSSVIDGSVAANGMRHAVPFSDEVTGVDRTDSGLLGSRSGSKHTLDAVYLRSAIDKGLLVQQLTEVRGIYQLSAGQGARYRVEAYDHVNKRMRSWFADRVVLAAGTLNTLRILLRSRDSNCGLSGMPSLGKNFGTNSDAIGFWSVDQTNRDFLSGLPCHGEINLKSPPEGASDAHFLQVGLIGFQHAKLPPVLVRYLRKNLLLVGFSADLANGTARWQRGRLRIDYHDNQSPSYAVVRHTFAEIAKRCNTPVHSLPFNLTVHPLGGCRPGEDEHSGVVNHKGEVHGHEGLYVVDAAALPGAPGVPPSMSIAAWSSHVCEAIQCELLACDKGVSSSEDNATDSNKESVVELSIA